MARSQACAEITSLCPTFSKINAKVNYPMNADGEIAKIIAKFILKT